MTFQLLYSSDASPDLDEAEIDTLIETSKQNNMAKGISGLLIYMNRCFLQLLEGEEQKVRELYGKISRDPRHTEPFVYHEQHAVQKAYGSWMTGYRQPMVGSLDRTSPNSQTIARKIQSLAMGKPLWIRSAVMMFGNAHAEIGDLYFKAQIPVGASGPV